ncbi:transposase [Erwinia tracheiphila]|uniref:Transposase n=1 Tax=Erwinia tracheiphila TaxID=65700 RepID=A0A0M2K7H0_9GAMM|nr:Integrase catalytic subunit [Erwinia tracheiphila PSU-1]KKF35340.1 transposase [Erwinia tracheiphila]
MSRDTFYCYQELAAEGGIDALVNQNRRGPNLTNRADEATERAVVEYAVEFPAPVQHRTSDELRKKGVFTSGSGVRAIWQRHDLENFRKRLKAPEEKFAREGIVLTGAPIAALEKKAHDDEASGEIETAHPGYPGSQDTFCAGNLKGGPYLPTDVRGYIPESGALQAVYE